MGRDKEAPSIARVRTRASRRSLSVRFVLSEGAYLRVAVERAVSARRFRRVTSFTRAIGAGRVSFSMSARRLARARYRVTLRPTDNARNVGRTVSGTFRIS